MHVALSSEETIGHAAQAVWKQQHRSICSGIHLPLGFHKAFVHLRSISSQNIILLIYLTTVFRLARKNTDNKQRILSEWEVVLKINLFFV